MNNPKEILEVLDDSRRCRDCQYFDELRFLEGTPTRAGRKELGWCKKLSIFAGPDWKACESIQGKGGQ